jgi:ABC-2 type transport system ATP-binding protein
MIKVSHLSKTFYVHKKKPGFLGSLQSLINREKVAKHALQDISLEVQEGEILGLIGANGAGKTTLTKILAGIIHPTQGEVSVLGYNPWSRANDYRRRMSLIMGQKQQLWWDLPAMDGFLLLKEIYQIPSQDFKERVDYLSNKLNVKDLLNVQVRKLSLGERMKVELIAALIHAPKVVYLDEPTIGLDLTAQKAVRSFLKEYREEFKPVMILTSHYMEDIEELCERIVVLKEGKIVYDGELQTVINRFAKNKLITATVKDVNELNGFIENFPQDLGKISVREDIYIDVVAPRDKTMESSKYLLNEIPILDLNIHERPIGDIIENIMQGGA